MSRDSLEEPVAKRLRSGCRRHVAADELAVVTGGSSGIGKATTLRLLDRGFTVVVMSHDSKQLKEMQELLQSESRPGAMISVCADICDESGCEAVAAAVRASGQTLRFLIHNAGVNTPCKMMMALQRKEWHKVMEINMNGPLFLTQALHPLFGKLDHDKNRILFLTTIAKMCTGLPNYGPYCVSKLGASGVALMFKEELSRGDPPIHTALLIPGEVDTGMQEATAYSCSTGFPSHLVQHWRMLHETKKLLPPAVAGAFIEYVMCDSTSKEFSSREWFLYDKSQHEYWADDFPHICLEEPKGLAGDH